MKKYFNFFLILITIIILILSISCKKPNFQSDVEQTPNISEEESKDKIAKYEENDDKDGEILWKMGIAKKDIYSDKNSIYILQFPEAIATLDAYEIDSGKQVWEWKDQWEFEGYIVGGDEEFLLLCREDGRLYSISKIDGELLWKVNLNDKIGSSFNKVVNMCSDNSNIYITIYLVGYDFYDVLKPYNYIVLALDKKNGDLLWFIPERVFCGLLLNDVEYGITQVKSYSEDKLFTDEYYLETIAQKNVENILNVSNNTILVMGEKLEGLDTKDGSLKWQTEINSKDCIIENDIIYGLKKTSAGDYFRNLDSEKPAICTEDRYDISRYDTYNSNVGDIVAIDSNSGTVIWETDNALVYDLIEVTDNSIYAADQYVWSDQYYSFKEVVWILGFNKKNGEFNFGGSYNFAFLGELDGKSIFSFSESGKTYAIDSTNGLLTWENDDLILQDLIGIYSNIIIGYKENFIFGIDKNNGSRIWRIESDSNLDYFSINKNNKIIKELVGGVIIEDKCIFKNGNKFIILNALNGEKIKELEIQQDGISVIGFPNTYAIFDDNYKILYLKS